MAPNSFSDANNIRMTDTHIFFWGSFLSNWDRSYSFSGARALELLLPRIDELSIAHPGPDAFSTQLISKHKFNCGEQFMMACKAWLFETAQKPLTLRAILASKKPMEQKALGRKVPGFNDNIWTPASSHIVIASLIARSEVDQRLNTLYENSGTKVFVEGSPKDRIWGVGIHWKEKSIENEENWQGENRLGKCHGLARDAIRKLETQNGERSKIFPSVESEGGELLDRKSQEGDPPREEP